MLIVLFLPDWMIIDIYGRFYFRPLSFYVLSKESVLTVTEKECKHNRGNKIREEGLTVFLY